MPLKYVAPDVRTCDYCGARTAIPKGISESETKRRLTDAGWTYRDFLILCPKCAKSNGKGKRGIIERVPFIGRLLG